VTHYGAPAVTQPPISETVVRLLFDYEELSLEETARLASGLPAKLQRWLGAHHPDNRTRKLFFEATGIAIGADTVINSGFVVSDGWQPLLTIGERVAIAPNVLVVCESGANNSQVADIPEVRERLIATAPVTIGDDAWIGANVTVLPGVTVGEASVVGAGSVVVEDVPTRSVAAGMPARVVRRLG
jgi:acetyltransferase-like isoleucine patch superfamily enzyme